MPFEHLNPHIRYANCHHSVYSKEYDHVPYDCRLFYITGGEIIIRIHDKIYNLKKYDAIFITPGTPYRFCTDDNESVSFIVLNFDQTSEFSHIKKSLGTAKPTEFNVSKMSGSERFEPFDKVLYCPEIRHIRYDLEDIVDRFYYKRNSYRDISSAKLKLVLVEIADKLSKESDKLSALADSVKEYIQENALSGVDNAAIASNFGYHSYYINRIFKEYTGYTLTQYIIHSKIKYAENLLLTTRKTIAEIAAEAGFQDIAYFTRVFHKKTGASPRKYRETNTYYNSGI